MKAGIRERIASRTRSARTTGLCRLSTLALLTALAGPVPANAAPAAGVADVVRLYDIPAQDMAAALKLFAEASNLQVMFSPDLVRNMTSRGVSGRFEPEVALGEILKGSNLVFRYVRADMVVVMTADAAGMAAASEGGGAAAGKSRPGDPGARASGTPSTRKALAVLHSDAAPATIDAVLVTAGKRSQALQDVAMSLTALDARRLEMMGAREYNDYLRSVPGVAFIDRGSGRNKIIIRGISDGPNSSTDATTGIYLDETPITEGLLSADFNLFDVERVEVLRGPQGTLYGAGSMGGTVRTILKKPDAGAFAAVAESTLSGTRHGEASYAVNGAVNVPLVEDKAAIRFVGSYRYDGGYIDDVIRDVDNVNHTTIKGARILGRLTPNERLQILAGVIYQDTTASALPASDIGRGPFEQARTYAENSANDWRLYSLQVNYDFGWAEFVSATSYFDKDTLVRNDYSPFLNPLLGLSASRPSGLQNDFTLRNLVQEMRMSSPGDRRLQWIAGFFYNDRKASQHQTGAVNLYPSGELVTLIDGLVQFDIQQVAVFGELTYNITDRFQATLGGRWFDVRQDGESRTSGLLYDAGEPQRVDVTSGKSSEQSQNFKFQLVHKIAADNMIYAGAAQGFRVGGPTGPIPEDTCAAGLAILGLPKSPTEFKADKLWNYEIGSKNSFFDNRLTVNAAAYVIDWTNIQVQRIVPVCGFSFIGNGPKASSKGFELEVALKPAEGLELAAGLAYTRTRMREDVPTIGAVAGDPLPNVPEWTFNGSILYSVPLNDRFKGYVRGDVQYVDGSYNDFTGLPTGFTVFQSSYTIGNLRIGLQEDRWEVAVFINNLWDKRAETYTQIAFGNPLTIINRPRTFGVHIKGTF